MIAPTKAIHGAATLRQRPMWKRSDATLVAVGCVFTLAMMWIAVPNGNLGADESMYASQANPRVADIPFSAPRARGITYLIAPILQVTGSTIALRAYLALLAGAALVLAYWPWLQVFRTKWVAPLAAGIFASLWVSQYYGADDMPDEWVALASVLAVGWFIRFHRTRSRRAPLAAGLAMAVAALFRPSDAVWLAIPLLITSVAVPRWRGWVPASVILGGLVLGLAEWVIEAYVTFGGLANRINLASREQGGFGWHPSGTRDTLASLAGPRLCRPCAPQLINLDRASTSLFMIWWFTLVLLSAVGVYLGYRARRLAEVALPFACAISVGITYLLTIDYAAPRFLLPFYALLALPAAVTVSRARSIPDVRIRAVALTIAALALTANLVSQMVVLESQEGAPPATNAIAIELRRAHIAPDCVLAGVHSTQVAYVLGCTTRPVHTSVHFIGRRNLALLTTRAHPSAPFSRWPRLVLPHPPGSSPLYAFVRTAS